MANFSFDIVSEYDKAEMNNVFDQVRREIGNRYDFKGTPADLEWLGDKTGLKITGSGEWQIEAIIEIVRKKLASRGLSQKILDTSREITESNLKANQDVLFVEGLNQDKTKQITKLLRDKFPKVKTQIQGEAVRVVSPKKDELQAVMQQLRSADLPYPLNFTNFR